MKKILLFFVAAFSAIASWADEVTATYTSSKIDVALANTTEFVAFQMDIKADGVTFGTPELNDVRLNQTGTAMIGGTSTAAPFVLASNVLTDGTLRVIAYNLANRSISLEEGNLFTVSVNGKPASVTLSNVFFVKASDLAEIAVNANAVEGADFLLGDVNLDGAVTLLDLTRLINVLASAAEETPTSDVNKDGSVTLLDLTRLINILAGK